MSGAVIQIRTQLQMNISFSHYFKINNYKTLKTTMYQDLQGPLKIVRDKNLSHECLHSTTMSSKHMTLFYGRYKTPIQIIYTA